jgi:hypothetical protein
MPAWTIRLRRGLRRGLLLHGRLLFLLRPRSTRPLLMPLEKARRKTTEKKKTKMSQTSQTKTNDGGCCPRSLVAFDEVCHLAQRRVAAPFA